MSEGEGGAGRRRRMMMIRGAPPADLKQVDKERRVVAIRHCGDAYHVTIVSGRTIPYWEFNVS